MRVFERFDASEPRVCAFASKLAKLPGFRAIPGSPFLWFLSFGEAKERDSPLGETLLKAVCKTSIARRPMGLWRMTEIRS